MCHTWDRLVQSDMLPRQTLLGPFDSKVRGFNMGPIWVREDPGGPHVGPMNFAIWDYNPWEFIYDRVPWISAKPLHDPILTMSHYAICLH